MVTVVLDTNVLISALVGHGNPRRLVLRLLEEGTGRLFHGDDGRTCRCSFKSRSSRTVKSSQVNSFLSKFARRVVVVTFKRRFKIVEEDPDDDIVLSTAYGGRCPVHNLGRQASTKAGRVQRNQDSYCKTYA